MKPDIVFLHTSPVHVATFENLVRELAPGLKVAHVVREDLLSDAQRDGASHAPLVARVDDAMREAGKSGAPVVVCTCSTIGGAAESMHTRGAFVAARIDRAMADEAVSKGRPVLVVAALASTLEPTVELIRTSAARLRTHPAIESIVVKGAWPEFLAGNMPGYIDAIVASVAAADASRSVVVLAQASMAPAAGPLAALGITALSSPRLGVERAVALADAKG